MLKFLSKVQSFSLVKLEKSGAYKFAVGVNVGVNNKKITASEWHATCRAFIFDARSQNEKMKRAKRTFTELRAIHDKVISVNYSEKQER